MKILFVCQHFPPEMGAQAARVSELAHHWVTAGHRVTVLTGFPNHPTGVIDPAYKKKFRRLLARETVDGIDVARTWLLPRPNRRPIERILNYTSFCLSSSLRGSFLSRSDVVIATSPQILIAVAGRWISWVKHTPFILEIRDLWPESIAASGIGSKSSLLYRIVKGLVGFLYKTSDHIVVVTPAFKDTIVSKWNIHPDKITIITNGVETDLFTPQVDTRPIKDELALDGKFVVSYVGTLGMAHGLTTVLEAALKVKENCPDVQFLLAGDGAEKDDLLAKIGQKNLNNVTLVPQQPKIKIPSIIRASDVCLVLLKKQEIFKTVLPTKMLEFMACERPIILGVEGQALEIMKEAQSGIAIEPENSDALVDAILHLRQNPDLRRRLGENGRRHVLQNFSREETAKAYVDLIAKVASKRSRSRSPKPTSKQEKS